MYEKSLVLQRMETNEKSRIMKLSDICTPRFSKNLTFVILKWFCNGKELKYQQTLSSLVKELLSLSMLGKVLCPSSIYFCWVSCLQALATAWLIYCQPCFRKPGQDFWKSNFGRVAFKLWIWQEPCIANIALKIEI